MRHSSGIDDAVKAHRAAAREHSFETMTVDNVTGEWCRHCGKNKESVRKPDLQYSFLPCRGLVG